MVKNPKRSLLSVFSALWDFFRKLFSLQRVPLQFLWYFTTHWVFKNPKGSRLSVFRHCETFFSKICFFSKGFLLQLQQKCWQFRKCPSFSAPGARASGPRRATQFFLVSRKKKSIKFRKKNFKVFFSQKVFCAFWALDMAPTLDVLVLFILTTTHFHCGSDAVSGNFK